MRPFEQMNLKELKYCCKDFHLKGYSKMNKKQLIKLLNDYVKEQEEIENSKTIEVEIPDKVREVIKYIVPKLNDKVAIKNLFFNELLKKHNCNDIQCMKCMLKKINGVNDLLSPYVNDFREKYNGLIDIEVFELLDIFNLQFKFKVEEKADNEYVLCYNQRTGYFNFMLMVLMVNETKTIDLTDLINKD